MKNKENLCFKILCLVMLSFSMLLSQYVHAQKRERVVVEGRIVEERTKRPVPGVNVTVLFSDSTHVTSFPTWNEKGHEGKFSFNLFPDSSYIFRFDKEGYCTLFVNKRIKKQSASEFDFGLNNDDYNGENLGDIVLKKNESNE